MYKMTTLKRGHTGILSKEDLKQVGNFALCVAARKFDANKNVKFSTYAWTYVQGYISHALRDKSRLVRLPRWVPQLRGKIKDLLEDGLTYAEIAETLDIEERKVFDCENSYGEIHVSIDVSSRDDDTVFSTLAVYEESLPEFQYPIEIMERAGSYSEREISTAVNFLTGEIEPTPKIVSLLWDVMDVSNVVWGGRK